MLKAFHCFYNIETASVPFLAAFGTFCMSCEFVTQLSKLRKQSMESVENTSSLDDFKKICMLLVLLKLSSAICW